MKVTTIVAAAAALLASAANPAWSQEAGFTVGGSIGWAGHREVCEGADISCDRRDTGWRISAGRQFNRHFAAELGYAGLGETSASSSVSGNARFETAAWDLVGIGSVPVWRQVSLFAKLGLYRAETWLHRTSSADAKESNADVTFGLGVRYELTRNLGLRADWQRYVDVGGDRTGETDVNLWSLGLLYRF